MWDLCSGWVELVPAPFFPSGAKVGAVSKPGTEALPFWMLLWVASWHRQLLCGHVPTAHIARGALNGIRVKYFSLNSIFTWQDPLCHL